jgi:hypothetical protein
MPLTEKKAALPSSFPHSFSLSLTIIALGEDDGVEKALAAAKASCNGFGLSSYGAHSAYLYNQFRLRIITCMIPCSPNLLRLFLSMCHCHPCLKSCVTLPFDVPSY